LRDPLDGGRQTASDRKYGTFGIDAFKRHLGGDDAFAAVTPAPVADPSPLQDNAACAAVSGKVE